MQRLSYLTETVLSNKLTRNRTGLSFKDSPRKPLRWRPHLWGYLFQLKNCHLKQYVTLSGVISALLKRSAGSGSARAELLSSSAELQSTEVTSFDACRPMHHAEPKCDRVHRFIDLTRTQPWTCTTALDHRCESPFRNSVSHRCTTFSLRGDLHYGPQ